MNIRPPNFSGITTGYKNCNTPTSVAYKTTTILISLMNTEQCYGQFAKVIWNSSLQKITTFHLHFYTPYVMNSINNIYDMTAWPKPVEYGKRNLSDSFKVCITP